MISVIITAYKEPDTIGKAIESFLLQILKKDEILAACPDEETAKVIKSYSRKYSNIKYVKDPGKGKPAALNLLFKKAKGDIQIFTDGDVFVSKNAVNEILNQFKDKNVGAVSGHPVSISPRNKILGYWSHLLTFQAHRLRNELMINKKFLVCSGYLFGIRKGIIEKIPEEVLSDDALMSYIVFNKGYSIGYAPNALVYVKYPQNFRDWINQKKRSTGGYNQLSQLGIKQEQKMRGFTKEISGFFEIFKFPHNLKEFFWTILLVFARAYMWLLIFYEINIIKRDSRKVWVRIESTK